MTTVSRSGRVRAVGFDELTVEELAVWANLQRSNPLLDSPYFHPSFSQAVHSTGLAVTVAIEEDSAGTPRAFLPVHRRGWIARPVGWPAADFQGPIHRQSTDVDLPALLRALGVRRFMFDHVPAGAQEFAPWVETVRPSPFLDVAGGLEAYLSRASRSGRNNMSQARRKARRAADELGEVRFVADSTDPELLDQVIALKRAQYRASGARDYFSDRRHALLLHRLLTIRDPELCGVLSGAYAGDRLLAAHLGIRSGPVLHWWFPVYEPELAEFAPGWILLRGLADSAVTMRVDRIDLGRGEDEYKRRAMTGHTLVAQGTVTTGRLGRSLHAARTAVSTTVRSSALAPTLRAAIRTARGWSRPIRKRA